MAPDQIESVSFDWFACGRVSLRAWAGGGGVLRHTREIPEARRDARLSLPHVNVSQRGVRDISSWPFACPPCAPFVAAACGNDGGAGDCGGGEARQQTLWRQVHRPPAFRHTRAAQHAAWSLPSSTGRRNLHRPGHREGTAAGKGEEQYMVDEAGVWREVVRNRNRRGVGGR